ncbi:adenine nucleotide alpha hydrolases-like protein, partial [Ascobolus immersus RN42]
ISLANRTFIKRVSFDTFDNKDAPDFSLTLQAKHKDYSYSRRSRTFLCGHDQNDYSDYALEWLLEELVDDGDEIVCLRVVDKDSKITSEDAVDGEKEYRAEARKLMEKIIEKNDDEKAISIILEFAIGKVQETIQRMIHIYEPVILIVGTRGRSLGGLQGLLPGSVSKYCLQHSPVPVIVVRPSNKREKKKKKRQADPSRRAYMSILEKSSYDSTFNLLSGARTPGSGNGGDVTPNIHSGPVSRRTSGEDTNLSPVIEGMKSVSFGESKQAPRSDDVSPMTESQNPIDKAGGE